MEEPEFLIWQASVLSAEMEYPLEALAYDRQFFEAHPGRRFNLRQASPVEVATSFPVARPGNLWLEVELLPNGTIRATARFYGPQFWSNESVQSDCGIADLLKYLSASPILIGE